MVIAIVLCVVLLPGQVAAEDDPQQQVVGACVRFGTDPLWVQVDPLCLIGDAIEALPP